MVPFDPQSEQTLTHSRASDESLLVLFQGNLLTDGFMGFGPWPAYCVLGGAYASISVLDYYLLKHHLIPTWIFRWKLAFVIVVVSSLVLFFSSHDNCLVVDG